jgi:lysylphosphatidylglycerol synthetase-like protein (DUF2156 family)
MDDGSKAALIGVLVVVVLLFFAMRGIVRLFQRHNSILIVLYLVFLFPVAIVHALILGWFGSSKAELADKALKEEVARELRKQEMLETARAKN